MSGFLGALGFLAVSGVLTLVLVLLLVRGLGRAWAESRRVAALARREGWRHLGSGCFGAGDGSDAWRGGAQQDSDSGDAWTDFDAAIPALRRGGFLLVMRVGATAPPRARDDAAPGLMAAIGSAIDRRLNIPPADPADDPRHWTEVPVGSPAFRAAACLIASEPRWAALVTPGLEALWFAAHPPGGAPVQIEARRQRLTLRRDDGRHLAPVEATVPMLRLGVALCTATQALADAP